MSDQPTREPARPKRDARKFEPYFRALAGILALKDWRIEISDDPPPGDHAIADVECVFGRKWAVVRLSDDFLDATEADQRHLTTHELIHCHCSHADGVVDDLLDRRGQRIYKRAVEYAVDGLADGIAPLLPLPSEILATNGNSPLPPVDRSAQ
jgi:hypothetical protein